MIDWMDWWWTRNVFLLLLLLFFIHWLSVKLNFFVWSALFLLNIYFLLLIRCSLVRARPSSSPCVQALRKRVKSLRSNDIFTFQRFLFLLYLLDYQFILALSLSLSSRSSRRRWFRLPIDREEKEKKRSLKSWQTVVTTIVAVVVAVASPPPLLLLHSRRPTSFSPSRFLLCVWFLLFIHSFIHSASIIFFIW